MAVTSSLNSIHISPRTPKTPRNVGGDDESDVELELLNEQERFEADRDVDEPVDHTPPTKKPISAKDKRSMALLCVLCERHPSELTLE
jgi:MFS transporter, PAT family, solute carrier family 33 (acetyl-CoA transportor), member 1